MTRVEWDRIAVVLDYGWPGDFDEVASAAYFALLMEQPAAAIEAVRPRAGQTLEGVRCSCRASGFARSVTAGSVPLSFLTLAVNLSRTTHRRCCREKVNRCATERRGEARAAELEAQAQHTGS
ncbi:MAG: hypothetical protein EBR82_58730 [Caulobacteraceae bacterium]|nr:hypothetical protein [Caulobacteraceae bacterium]